jgi:hypothetical protein
MGRPGAALPATAPYGAMPGGPAMMGGPGGRRSDMAAMRAQQDIMDVHQSFGGGGRGARGPPHDSQARFLLAYLCIS